ncbi:MAG TPA: protein kinase [Methanosarcinales archaeon]|nr:protein kinase [Methanosarcinales archaeon]
MFQSSTASILPTVNLSITQDFKSTGYSWQRWAKWGLLSAGGLAATAAIIYGGPMIFTGLFSLMTGIAAKLSRDGQGNTLAPFEPSNMLMPNPVDIASPATQGGLDKDDWLAEFIGSTSKELPEYLKDTIKEQPADLDEAVLAEDTEELAEPPSAKTDADIIEISSPDVMREQKSSELKLAEFGELPLHEFKKRQPGSSFPAVIKLSSLDGSNGFKLDGEEKGERSGMSVSSAGDVNGDNIADLIIGAYWANPYGRSVAGRSYVVFGHNGSWISPLKLSSLDGTNGFGLDGEEEGDYSGWAVSGAGDVNDDSIADLIVGAYEARSATGRSYVVFGHNGTWPSSFPLSSLDGTNGFKLDGEEEGDYSGWQVSGVGDINDDNIVDLIISAYGARSVAGRSYVVFGHNGTWPSSFLLSSLNGTNGFKLDGEEEGDNSGASVSGAGDINGDNIADLIVGAYEARGATGRSYVVFGHNGTWPSSFLLSSLNGTNGFKLDGETTDDKSGASVSGAGDINGDNIADLIIGAPYANPPGKNAAGRSYVMFGQYSYMPAGGELLWLIGLVIGLTGVIGCAISGFFLKRYLNRRAYIKLESTNLPFRIIRQIGRGGNAEVYEGEWIKTGLWHGKHVAIKKLPDMFTDLTEVTNEFTKEARFLEEYRHPNLIEFIRFFAAPHWCLVLKYYYRGSLDKVLTDERYLLPWNPERNGFMKGIAEGLRFLHEKGIIHRDMKPGNVLIDEDMTPKITDLGTARIQDTITMTKGIGTPAYVAPEIIKPEDGEKIRYTNSVDVYSYGFVLWAIWHRKEPFTEFEQIWQIMKYAIDEQNRPSLNDCPSLSLAKLIGRCWAHRAKTRPSMQEVCEELNTVTAELAFA